MKDPVSKQNIDYAVEIWHRVRGNAVRRYAGYLILAAIAAQSNVVQYLLTGTFAVFGVKAAIPDTAPWLPVSFVILAAGLLVFDRLVPEKQQLKPDGQEQELASILRTGEDIISRQCIMASSSNWRQDPAIGVRNEEGALWRQSVRRYLRQRYSGDPAMLAKIEDLLDINKHIFDEKFNRVHGTEAGMIDSYLNHSYRIQSFLKAHG